MYMITVDINYAIFESYLAVYIWGRCYLISLIIIARSLNSYDFSKKN